MWTGSTCCNRFPVTSSSHLAFSLFPLSPALFQSRWPRPCILNQDTAVAVLKGYMNIYSDMNIQLPIAGGKNSFLLFLICGVSWCGAIIEKNKNNTRNFNTIVSAGCKGEEWGSLMRWRWGVTIRRSGRRIDKRCGSWGTRSKMVISCIRAPRQMKKEKKNAFGMNF